MLINLRNALMTGKADPIPYVHHHMNHWWDGEHNAGLGLPHDPQARARQWVDLVGGLTLTKHYSNSYYATFANGNFLETPSTSKTSSSRTSELWTSGSAILPGATAITVEIVFDLSMTTDFAPFDRIARDDDELRVNFNLQTASFNNCISPVVNAPIYSQTYQFLPPQNTSTYLNTNYAAVTIDESGLITAYWNGGNALTKQGTSNMAANLSALTIMTLGRSNGTIKIYAKRTHLCALNADEIARNYSIDKARFGLP
jgi:hypothetical protein